MAAIVFRSQITRFPNEQEKVKRVWGKSSEVVAVAILNTNYKETREMLDNFEAMNATAESFHRSASFRRIRNQVIFLQKATENQKVAARRQRKLSLSRSAGKQTNEPQTKKKTNWWFFLWKSCHRNDPFPLFTRYKVRRSHSDSVEYFVNHRRLVFRNANDRATRYQQQYSPNVIIQMQNRRDSTASRTTCIAGWWAMQSSSAYFVVPSRTRFSPI